MRLAVFVLLGILSSVAQAAAGAWLRAEGEAFLSFSQELDDRQDTYTSALLEYGLAPDLTLGFDAGWRDDDDEKAVIFLRHPLGAADGNSRLAADFGLGQSSDGFVLRPGLSWGRGLDTPLGAGWLGVETTAEYRADLPDIALKADTTVGLRRESGTLLYLQFQAGDLPGSDPYLRLAPTVATPLTDNVNLEIGLITGLIGDDTTAIKIGTWLAF